MSNNKRKTLTRAMAFFLCIIMVIGLLIQVLPNDLFVGNVVNAEDSTEYVNPKGLDTGNGEILEWVIEKKATKGPNRGKVYLAYLYEADTGYRINASLLNESNSPVEGAIGQYFYWPNVPWVGVTGGPDAKPAKLSDIRDFTNLNAQSKETALENAKYISSMNTSDAPGWLTNNMSQYMGGEKAEYFTNIPKNMQHNFKHNEESHPFNRWIANTNETKQRSTAFLWFDGLAVTPRSVLNKNGGSISYIGMPGDTTPGIYKTIPSKVPYNPLDVQKEWGVSWFTNGSVNDDWMFRETDWKGKPLFEDMRSSFSYNGRTISYLDPDKADATQAERDKVRALLLTVESIDMTWGNMPVTMSFDDTNNTLTPSLNEHLNVVASDRGIWSTLSMKDFLNVNDPENSDVRSFCPGPLTKDMILKGIKDPVTGKDVTREYILASNTAKAIALMKHFEITGYAGENGYSQMSCVKTDDNKKRYATFNVPKVAVSKDLTMWGGIDLADKDNDLYNAGMWKPKEDYEEKWLELDEEGKDDNRKEALAQMSMEEFLEKFQKVDPETKKQEDGTYTGGLLDYDYPYVWIESISLKTGESSSNSSASQTYHNDIKAGITRFNLKPGKESLALYNRNQAALKGEGAAGDRTVALMELTIDKVTGYMQIPGPFNNLVEQTEGRNIFNGDAEIRKISNSDAFFLGGRLWAFNAPPWNGLAANEYRRGTNVDNAKPAPASDEEHKAINVNIYRSVMRTPKVDEFSSSKPDKKNPAFVAYAGLLSSDNNFYRDDYTDGKSKIKMFEDWQLYNYSVGVNVKRLKDFNDNGNLLNDTALVVYMMGDASDNKRNLIIHSATVRNEDGTPYDVIDVQPEKNTHICYLPEISEEQAQRGEFKNYYIDWEMLYQNPNTKKLPTQSIKTDLGTIGYYKQNIKGFNDSNGENYETSTNLKSFWDITSGLDIGKYNSSVPAKGYNQATSTYDNRVVPMAELAKLAYENETGLATADYIIQIPRKYDNEDNTNLSDWETLKIHFEQKVAKKDEVDNAITKIILHDQTHPGTDFVGDPNAEVPIHIGCTYNAEIIVSRIAGTEPKTNLNDDSAIAFDGTKPINKTNSMIIRGIVGTVPIGKVGTGATTGKEFVYGVYDGQKNGSGILARPNDTMSYTISNLKPTDTGYIEIRAFFNPKDYREDNNYMIAKFGGAADYVLENLELTQDVINLPPNQSQTTDVRINFSAEIGLNYDRASDPNGQRDPTLRATTVAVLMFEKGPNDFTYTESSGRVVWLDNNVQLTPNTGPRPISGTLGYGATPQSQGSPIAFRKDYSYRFIAVINAGNSTANGNLSDSFDHRFRNKVAQTFMKETDNHNNESQHEVTVKAPITPTEIKPYCWDKKTGLCNKAHTRNSWTVTFYYTECPIAVYYTCCSGDPSTCSTCCYGSGCHSWTTDKTFTETFEVQGWFRSVDTDEQWVKASTNAAVVRAGHWFDFKAVTIYNTDRANMPPPNPYGGCAWLSRSPGYSQPSGYRWVRVVMDNPTGGQRKIYNSFQSGWKQELMPQRYTVPESTMNLTITFTVDVDEFKGYWVDREHPKIELCDCTTYTMKVQNPLPVIDGSTSIW